MRKQPVTQPKKTEFNASDDEDASSSSDDDDDDGSIDFPGSEGDEDEYGSDGGSVGSKSIGFGSDEEEDGEEDGEEEDSSAAATYHTSNKKKTNERETKKGKGGRDKGKGKDKPENDAEQDQNNEDTFYQKITPADTDRLILKSHPQLVTIGTAEMSAMARIVRDRNGKIVDPMHQTMPFLTKYESTTVIGTRAEQIEQGAPPFIDLPDSVIDSYTIAKMEFDAGVLPLIISRPLPDGTTEYWNLSDLERLH